MNDKLTIINIVLIIFVIGFVFGGLIGHYSSRQISSPVEKDKIDSLVIQRDSIKLKVENLDSIKDAKIIEVSTLDNDSTLKLFYKLVSE